MFFPGLHIIDKDQRIQDPENLDPRLKAKPGFENKPKPPFGPENEGDLPGIRAKKNQFHSEHCLKKKANTPE